MPDALELAEQYRRALDRHDAAAIRRLVQTYGNLYRRLQGDIDALLLATEGKTLTATQIRKLEQFTRLMEDTARELNKYSGWLDAELRAAAQASVRLGIQHSTGLMNGVGIRAAFRTLSPDVVETLLGFLSEDSPLWQRLEALAPERAKDLAEWIIDGILRGKGPRETARNIRKALGVGLSDSLRMMRTVQLYSYREASRANYVANRANVGGWIWWARRDGLVCGCCLAMHGTIHTVDERLSGHHNCRCIPIPYLLGQDPRSVVWETGEEWFSKQPEAYQRKLLGPGKWQALRDGKFTFADLTDTHEDEVYGPMWVEKRVMVIVGG